MNICFVSERPFPWGGTSAREVEFARGLVKAGHDVYMIPQFIKEEQKDSNELKGIDIRGKRSRLFEIADKNFEILKLGLNSRYYFKELNKLRDKIDVIHYSNHSRAFLGSFYNKFLDIPSIASLHNSVSPKDPEFKKGRLKREKEFKEKHIAPHHDGILITTDRAKEHFLNKYSKRCKGQVFVAHNPIDYTEVEKFRRNTKSITNKELVIGKFTSSRVGPKRDAKKEYKKIIDEISGKHENAKFLFIGKKPPQHERIDDPRIEYTGYVDDLDEVFSRLRLGIVTGSIWTGGGIRSRATEFIKRGVPIVGYPPLAVRPSWEFAEEEGAMILKEDYKQMGEIINRILTDERKLKDMEEACYSATKRLSYENITPILERCYDYAIEKHGE